MERRMQAAPQGVAGRSRPVDIDFMNQAEAAVDMRVLEATDLQLLFDLLIADGHELRAPTIRDGAIVFGSIGSVEQLPRHVGSRQSPGTYRLEADDHSWFSHGPAATGLKPWLHVPRETLVTLRRKTQPPPGAARSEPSPGGSLEAAADIEAHTPAPAAKPVAFVGARACDLAAVSVQDHVLCETDPAYASRRSAALLVAVSCTRAVESCFCASMNTGPRVTKGFDLCLTEIDGEPARRFVVEAGSTRGRDVLGRLPTRQATEEETAAPDAIAKAVADSQVRRLDTHRIRERLQANPEHPRLDDVATRCLSCTNCTLVCPTCFCSTVEDQASLDEAEVSRVRRWDSCFSPDFAYLHGGTVRDSTRARYRQWLTHKLSTWYDQFGESGCIGCGRCITWCPVGIDITEEANSIFDAPGPEQADS